MVDKTITTKSLQVNEPGVDITSDLELINKHTIKPLSAEDVYLFKVKLCDNDIDRVYDKMSDGFLEAFAQNSKNLTGIKDHDWRSENQMSRLYDTELVVSDKEVNELGEPLKYVVGKAYTLSIYKEYIDKINAGILKETSVGFSSIGDTCSICGEVTEKDCGGVAHCKNGHVAGKEYDGVICFNSINSLTDSYEWSFTPIPCQRNSGVKNKNISNGGNKLMKKSMYKLQKIFATKAFKEADPETQEVMKEVLGEDVETEISDEDIKSLIAENTSLKEQLEQYKSKAEAAEIAREEDKIEAVVEKSVDSLRPLTPVVKENIMRDINVKALKLENGVVTGLDEVLKNMQVRYAGLFVVEEPAKKETTVSVKSFTDNHNSGLKFGVNDTTKTEKKVIKQSGQHIGSGLILKDTE